MTDEEIVQLFFQRKEEAVQEINRKYGSYCFKIANSILNNREDSEECVNDTWMKTWNSIPPTIPTYLRVFLGKITRNLSFDKYRFLHSEKRGGGEIGLVLEELEEVIAGRNSVEALYEQKELIEAINTYLHTLSERDCNVFIRRYFFAEDAKTIAKKYDLKESNVQMILSRTRKKLQQHLKEEELL